MIYVPAIYSDLALYERLMNLIIKFLVFSALISWMYKRQDFEFKRSAKKWIYYFIADQLSLFLGCYVFYIQRDLMFQYRGKFFLIVYILNVPQIIIAIAIIYLKDENDYIQEISYLEYQMPVSIF